MSGGEDGAILVWNVRSVENKPKYSITMPPPLAVTNLSMSPDGAHIAVATHDRIMVWKMGENTIPKASWVPQPGWQSPGTSTDSEDAIPCLGWDSEGQRLVYGLENRVCLLCMCFEVCAVLTLDSSPSSHCGRDAMTKKPHYESSHTRMPPSVIALGPISLGGLNIAPSSRLQRRAVRGTTRIDHPIQLWSKDHETRLPDPFTNALRNRAISSDPRVGAARSRLRSFGSARHDEIPYHWRDRICRLRLGCNYT